MKHVTQPPAFIPTTAGELRELGWQQPDVILVTGDAYIDSPHIGVAVIGRVLMDAGYRVGIIAQPDIGSGHDITRMGEPALFWGVTAGSIDSMIANYTASGKRRKSDDLTPCVFRGRSSKIKFFYQAYLSRSRIIVIFEERPLCCLGNCRNRRAFVFHVINTNCNTCSL